MSQNSQTTRTVLIRPVPRFVTLPRPLVARVESLPPGTVTPWHSHAWWQLAWAMRGVMTLETRQGSYIAPPQRAILVPPGVEHQATNASRTEMRSLYLDCALMEWAAPRCRVLEMSALVRELILAVGLLPQEYDPNAANTRLIGVLIDQLATMPEVHLNLPLPEDPRLARICNHLQANPDDPRTMGEWAGLVGLSERSLARNFRLQTGMSFGDWRQRMRMLLALAALERGERVTRVALDAGYASASAFIAAFRKTFGVTPSAMFA